MASESRGAHCAISILIRTNDALHLAVARRSGETVRNASSPETCPHLQLSLQSDKHGWQGVHFMVQPCMDETETPREDWRDWYRMTSFERMEEGLSDQADLEPDFSRETFLEWRHPRSGTENPAQMHSPVWEWFVRTGLNAYAGNKKFQGPSSFGFEPCWCNDRMGQTAMDLPDGRLVLIAGEHEDYYYPDFYIYNDTIVLHKDGEVEILGYPREVFPPTDFHTSTLTGEHIIIIGNLGYPEDRMPGQTQVFTLNVRTLAMGRVAATGERPGWISRHTAELTADDNSIVVKGGEIWRADATLLENLDEWKLRLDDWRWERLTRRLWPRWILERTDEKRLHLSEYSNVKWYRQVKWDAEKEKASLRDSLKGEPEIKKVIEETEHFLRLIKSE